MATTIRRVRITISGRVQNVGFRAYVQRRATSLNLSGWVRNVEGERRVELEAQGVAEDVAELIEVVTHGPSVARVEEVLVHELEPQAGITARFHVR